MNLDLRSRSLLHYHRGSILMASTDTPVPGSANNDVRAAMTVWIVRAPTDEEAETLEVKSGESVPVYQLFGDGSDVTTERLPVSRLTSKNCEWTEVPPAARTIGKAIHGVQLAIHVGMENWPFEPNRHVSVLMADCRVPCLLPRSSVITPLVHCTTPPNMVALYKAHRQLHGLMPMFCAIVGEINPNDSVTFYQSYRRHTDITTAMRKEEEEKSGSGLLIGGHGIYAYPLFSGSLPECMWSSRQGESSTLTVWRKIQAHLSSPNLRDLAAWRRPSIRQRLGRPNEIRRGGGGGGGGGYKRRERSRSRERNGGGGGGGGDIGKEGGVVFERTFRGGRAPAHGHARRPRRGNADSRQRR